MSLKAKLQKLAGRAGYQITREVQPIYADPSATEKNIRLVRGNTMLPRPRLVSLADQVAWIAKHRIPGALVECGVWKGGGVGMMAATLRDCEASERKLHLFDSFTDICPPDPSVDGARAVEEAGHHLSEIGAAQKPMTGFYDSVGGHGTVDLCRELLDRGVGYPMANVCFHPGWFENTLPAVRDTIGQIALLRLDGDWYSSTKVCLDNLYALVVPGGIVIIDDYGSYEGCRRAVDEFLEMRGVQAFLSSVDNGCYFFSKPRQ